jgi:hypothetical protein
MRIASRLIELDQCDTSEKRCGGGIIYVPLPANGPNGSGLDRRRTNERRNLRIRYLYCLQSLAVLEYPQSGERIRGRRNIQASRTAQPNKKRFTVRRIIGAADLWVTEFILKYDGAPSYTVSIMEFSDGKVARETQYFGDPFEPGPSRAQWVERMR